MNYLKGTSALLASFTQVNGAQRHLSKRMPLGEVGSVRRDAVGHKALFHVVLVGQAEMLLKGVTSVAGN